MKRFMPSNFFISLVLVSCIIGILPLILLGYLSYNKSAFIVRDEVTAGNRLILMQNKQQVESLLKMIDTLTIQTISGPISTNAVSLSTLLDSPYNYQNIKLFESLIYKLVQIQVFELGTESINMISFRQNWIIDSGAVFRMENRNTSTEINRKLHRLHQQLTEYRNDQRRSFWTMEHEAPAGWVLKLIKRIPLNASDPYGLLAVSIPMKEISRKLTGGDQLGEVGIIDSEGTVVAHLDSSQIGTSVSEMPFYQEILHTENPDGHFSYKLDGKEHDIIYNRSTYNGWMYVSLTPLERLAEKSDIIKGYTMIAAGIFIVLIVIASIAASLWTYSPIRSIYRFIKRDASQYKGNELEYIGDQVKYMIQSRDRMVSEMESLHRQARTLWVIQLLQGDFREDHVEYNVEQRGFPTAWEQWSLVAVQMDTLEGTPYTTKDREILMFAIQNIVEEIIPEEAGLSPVWQHQCLMIFIGTSADVTTPLKVHIFHLVQTVQQSVKRFLKLKVSIGISRGYTHFLHAPRAKQECLDALTYRLRLGEESILFIDEVQPENQDMFRYPKDLEFHIMEAVRQTNTQQAREGLNQMIAQFFAKHVSHYDYQIFVGRLFNNLTGMVQDAGMSVQNVFRIDALMSDIMHGMRSPQEIRDWFDAEILLPLLGWMEERQRRQTVNISQAVIEHIRHNFDQDLDIVHFASLLNYHPSYISRVFKKDTGVTLTDFIAQYRMDMAKKWLTETEMKISDIAEKLRYSTASNFNRKFKKIEKITPSEYREKYK